jgi:RNA polymerase sigma-70 factor (ECF subfamily)
MRLLLVVEDTKPPGPADGALVLAAVLGNLEAFGELVRRYRRAAVRIAAGIAGPEAAEDIAQDALLLAFQALPDLDEPDRFAAWLSSITRNRALRVMRREHRMPRVEFDDALLACVEGSPIGELRQKEAASDLVEGLERLPEGCRFLMRLRWLDEMSMQEISAFTGLPVSTVKWRLHEGKRLLREWTEAGRSRSE